MIEWDFVFMPRRLSYEESCRALQRQELISQGAIPPLPPQMPRFDDVQRGIHFSQAMIADAEFEGLTLPRVFFGRSEVRNSSFKNSELRESRANWNDFINVDFTLADLSNSDLRGCLFERVRFTRANLFGVDFRYCGFKNCDFSEADVTQAKFTQKVGAALRLSPEQISVIDWQDEDGEEPEA